MNLHTPLGKAVAEADAAHRKMRRYFVATIIGAFLTGVCAGMLVSNIMLIWQGRIGAVIAGVIVGTISVLLMKWYRKDA